VNSTTGTVRSAVGTSDAAGAEVTTSSMTDR
jgi:hypothetical protein